MSDEKVEPLTVEEETELRAYITRAVPREATAQRLLATLDAMRARAAQIAEDRDAAWRDVEKLQAAYDAVQSGHGWCRCHDALVPVLEERDALAAQVAALTKEIAARADTETSLTEQLLKSCEEHDALAAQLAALRGVLNQFSGFVNGGYANSLGESIQKTLWVMESNAQRALALTPTEAVARIEALEAVVQAARRRSLRWHDTHCLALRMDNYEADRCTCGHTALRRALVHPALRYIGKEKG